MKNRLQIFQVRYSPIFSLPVTYKPNQDCTNIVMTLQDSPKFSIDNQQSV